MTYAKPIFKKINVVQNGAGKDGDFAVFGSSILLSRMEDMLLLRAEALAVLNRVDDAVEQLNQLRVKRGLSQVSFKKNFGEDVNKLIDNIFAERRRELIGEGHRWYDLVRWDIAQKVLNGQRLHGIKIEKTGSSFLYTRVECDTQDRKFPKKYNIFPIPSSELRNNIMCEQTPSWK